MWYISPVDFELWDQWHRYGRLLSCLFNLIVIEFDPCGDRDSSVLILYPPSRFFRECEYYRHVFPMLIYSLVLCLHYILVNTKWCNKICTWMMLLNRIIKLHVYVKFNRLLEEKNTYSTCKTVPLSPKYYWWIIRHVKRNMYRKWRFYQT